MSNIAPSLAIDYYSIKLAYAVPHTPWVEARVRSFDRLNHALGLGVYWTDSHGIIEMGGQDDSGKQMFRFFTERAPNHVWSKEMWEWGESVGGTHFLQLQDDVIVAPNFWQALRAMIAARPNDIIGLESAHPAMRLIARDGFRWCYSKAWMVGVGYVLPSARLKELNVYRASLPDTLAVTTNEDEVISRFCIEHDISIWHPLPTIIDHDTNVPSTYGHENHLYRKPVVTWRDYNEKELERLEFWKGDGPLIRNPHHSACWICEAEPGLVVVSDTAARVGKQCLATIVSKTILSIRT